MSVAELTQPAEEAVRRDDDAAAPQDRLDDDRADPIVGVELFGDELEGRA